jgi:hypothetical protein
MKKLEKITSSKRFTEPLFYVSTPSSSISWLCQGEVEDTFRYQHILVIIEVVETQQSSKF